MMLKKLTEALQIVEAGYDGYSMSNNARAAYDAGMMPLSKWTKSDILDGIRAEYDKYLPDAVFEVIKKLPLGFLKDKFLETREWHHTSSMYNATDFYQIDADYLDIDNTAEGMIDFLKQDYAEWKADYDKERAKKKAVKDSKGDFCYFKYLVWGGSRAHPRAYNEESYGYVKGDWIYFADENGNLTGRKKGLYSNGTEVIKYLEPGEKIPVKEEPKKKEKVSKPKKNSNYLNNPYPLGTEDWYKWRTENRYKGVDSIEAPYLEEDKGGYKLTYNNGYTGGVAYLEGKWSKPILYCCSTVRIGNAIKDVCPKHIGKNLIIEYFTGTNFDLSDVVVDGKLKLKDCYNLKTLKGIPQAREYDFNLFESQYKELKGDIEELRKTHIVYTR